MLVDFTGYACTNCHWMKANMFTKPEIGGVMKNMVLVDLYTDGTDAASRPTRSWKKISSRPSRFPFMCSMTRIRMCSRRFPARLGSRMSIWRF